MEDKPLVSIRLMVYNNEPYIKETVESILMQKTEFKVEIVVGDDFSTDNTLKIIRSYKDTEKITIRILDRPKGGEYWQKRKAKNAFVRTNFMDIVENCHGKYIALLDGDDYWTDPLKLQKQVDFLEANEDYALVFTNGQVVYTNTHEPSHLIYNNTSHSTTSYRVFNLPEETTDIYKLAKGNYIHTAGVVFRNWIIEQGVPEYMYRVTIGDWPLHMMTATKGLIKYLDEDMFCYRVHDVGVYSKKTALQKNQMTLGQFPPILNSNYFENSVREVIETYCLKSSKSYLSACKTGNDFQFFTDFSGSFDSNNEVLNNKLLQLLDKRNQNQNKVLIQPVYLRLLKRIKRYIKKILKL